MRRDGRIATAQPFAAPIPKQTGADAIAPRYIADFIVLDTDTPALVRRSEDGIIDGWIFAARQSPVREVWVGGKRVVTEGKNLSREPVFRRFKATIARIVK